MAPTSSFSPVPTHGHHELTDAHTLSVYEERLDKFYDQNDKLGRLYSALIDALLKTIKKEAAEEPADTPIRRLTILRRFVSYIDGMDVSRVEEARAKLDDENSERLRLLFVLALKTRWYDEFKHLLEAPKVAKQFAAFLNSKIDEDLTHVLPWAFNSGCISHCNVQKIIARAVIDSRSNEKAHVGTIVNFMKTHPNPDAVGKMVEYLDQTVALHMRYYYKKTPTGPTQEPQMALELHKLVSVNQLLKFIFKLRMKCGLDESTVPNAVFVRKIKTLLKIHSENISGQGDQAEFFHQKVLHLMDNDPLMHHAVLKVYSRKDIKSALYFATFHEIDQKEWPRELHNATDEDWKPIRELVQADKQKMTQEYEEYKRGLILCRRRSGHHLIFLIDHPDELNSLFYPFLDETVDSKFGFDTEWEQSYAGEIGTLGLLQISTSAKTMLIDVVTFSTFYNYGQEQWTKFFSRLFHAKNQFYGFALESDLKTILYNFPYLAETDCPKNENMICLRTLFNTLSYEQNELYESLFERGLPSGINLAEISSKFMGVDVPKVEQASAWTYRPLRLKQIKYAAMDSFLCITIREKLHGKLKEKLGEEETTRLFAPIEWPSKKTDAEGGTDSNFPLNVGGGPNKKSKSQHFTNEELVSIVEASNRKLSAQTDPTVDSKTRLYVADSMCSQLGILLRRCGVSVIPGNELSEIIEMCIANSEYRIMSCGKAVQKFPFINRVLNIAASSTTLDVQLNQFLRMERLIIDVDEMHTRCSRCNSEWLVRVPTAVMRYLHMSHGLLISGGMEGSTYSPEEMFQAKEQLDCIKQQPFINYNICVCDGGLGHLYVTPNGMIDLSDLKIMRLHDYSSIRGVGALPLTLATHVNYATTDFPASLMHAVCGHCGRETVESTLFEDSTRTITWK